MSIRVFLYIIPIVLLVTLAMGDPMPRGSLSETRILDKSRWLVAHKRYKEAIQVLDFGLLYNPRSVSILREFKKDLTLYLRSEWASGKLKKIESVLNKLEIEKIVD